MNAVGTARTPGRRQSINHQSEGYRQLLLEPRNTRTTRKNQVGQPPSAVRTTDNRLLATGYRCSTTEGTEVTERRQRAEGGGRRLTLCGYQRGVVFVGWAWVPKRGPLRLRSPSTHAGSCLQPRISPEEGPPAVKSPRLDCIDHSRPPAISSRVRPNH
jgi:hypothetical protein